MRLRIVAFNAFLIPVLDIDEGMASVRKFIRPAVVMAISLTTTACGQPIDADYCVGVSIDESGSIAPDDNDYIVEVIDQVILPLGYAKSDAPAIVEYEKNQKEFSTVNILRNVGRLGTMIAHFSSPDDTPFVAGRDALIAAVDNEIRSKYLVRDCEEISVGSTPKLYN